MDNNNQGNDFEEDAEDDIADNIEINRSQGRSRMTNLQLDTIVHFMVLHPIFAQDGDLGLNGHMKKDGLWKKLAEEVSAIGNAQKSVTQCMNAWNNMKKRAIDKLAKINMNQRKSSPPVLPSSALLDERDYSILNIWGTAPAVGLRNGTLGAGNVSTNLPRPSASSHNSLRPPASSAHQRGSAHEPGSSTTRCAPRAPQRNSPNPSTSSSHQPRPSASRCTSATPQHNVSKPSTSSADHPGPSTAPTDTSRPSNSFVNESGSSISSQGIPRKRKRPRVQERLDTLVNLSDVSAQGLRAMQNYSEIAERYFPQFAEFLRNIRDSFRELIYLLKSCDVCSSRNAENLPPRLGQSRAQDAVGVSEKGSPQTRANDDEKMETDRGMGDPVERFFFIFLALGFFTKGR